MELDDLKKSWQEANTATIYDSASIFRMLKTKSTSIAKALFYFTVFEFLLVIGFFVYSILLGNQSIEKVTLQYIDPKTLKTFEKSSIVGIVLTLIFMVLSYRYYKKIRFDSTTKELISSIITFRKVINLFILFTVLLLVITSAPMYYELGKGIYLSKHSNEINSSNQAEIYGYVAVAIAVFFILIFAMLYYSILYFAFLKKFMKNLKELKEVE